MDLAHALFQDSLTGYLWTGGSRWLVFNPDCGSVAERDPNPGNWEAARPVEICRSCSRLVVSP